MAKAEKRKAGAKPARDKKKPKTKLKPILKKLAKAKVLTKTKPGGKKTRRATTPIVPVAPLPALGPAAAVLDRLWDVVTERRTADVTVSHSARLLSRGTAKVAQKFGEEAVECLIEATLGNREGLIGESADVLYHLIVLWVNAGIRPEEIWAELKRREGISGIAEKASRAQSLPAALGVRTTKIP